MTTTTSTTTATRDVRRHPIRGALWGIPVGLGLALFLVGQKLAAFGTLPPLFAVVAGPLLGVLWAYVAPAKGPKSGPPASTPVVTDLAPPQAAPWTDTHHELP